MPDLVRGYRAQVQRAIAVLAKPEAVEDGRESMRRLLEDGRITLAPNPSHTAVAGPVYFEGARGACPRVGWLAATP
jgi:hypothetical protein